MSGKVESPNTVVVHTLNSYVQPEKRIVSKDSKDKAISNLVQCRICLIPKNTNELRAIPQSNKRCVYALDPVICQDCVSSTQTCPLCHDIINDSDDDSQIASLSIESLPDTITINIQNPNSVQGQQGIPNFAKICKITSIAGVALTLLAVGVVCLVTLVKKN